jgi:hypothetical protein
MVDYSKFENIDVEQAKAWAAQQDFENIDVEQAKAWAARQDFRNPCVEPRDLGSSAYLRGDELGVFVEGAVVVLNTSDSFDGELGRVQSFDDAARKWKVKLLNSKLAHVPLDCPWEELRFLYRVPRHPEATAAPRGLMEAPRGTNARALVAARGFRKGEELFAEPPLLVATSRPDDATRARWLALQELKRWARVKKQKTPEFETALASFEALATGVASLRPGAFCGLCGRERATLLKCGRCKTAAFCGPACFRGAWRAGHRETCGASPDRLHPRSRRWLDALRLVDEDLKHSFRSPATAAIKDDMVRKVADCDARFDACGARLPPLAGDRVAVYARAGALDHAALHVPPSESCSKRVSLDAR